MSWTRGAHCLWLKRVWSAEKSWYPHKTFYTNYTTTLVHSLPSPQQAAQKKHSQSLLCYFEGVNLKWCNDRTHPFHAFLILDSLETEWLSQELRMWLQTDRIQKVASYPCDTTFHADYEHCLCKQNKLWMGVKESKFIMVLRWNGNPLELFMCLSNTYSNKRQPNGLHSLSHLLSSSLML